MEETQHIQIKSRFLKAMTYIMASNDIRYYLNGVAVEATPTHTTLIATNGHSLLVIREEVENTISQPELVIIPDVIVKQMLLGKKMKTPVPIRLVKSDGQWEVPMLSIGNGTSIKFSPYEAAYPSWRNVLTKHVGEPTGEAATYNPHYLMDFQKAAATALGVGPKSVILSIKQNGNNGAIISARGLDEFIGVLMPYRDTPSTSLPAWTKEPAPESIESFYRKKK